jgi:hypothetical protein
VRGGDRQFFEEAGFDDHVPKPVDFEAQKRVWNLSGDAEDYTLSESYARHADNI